MGAAVAEVERERAQQILRILRGTLTVHDEDFASVLVAKETSDPFHVLVETVLSQNCTDISSLRAYRRLDRRVGVTPAKLSRANIRSIESSIRVAGLYRQKARALKQIAKATSSRKLNRILRLELEEARMRLQEMPKVGPKTADVLLSIWGRPTISVDTHVERVSKRLGLAPEKGRYEEVRGSLMALFKKRDYSLVPLLFMAHGRRFCKAISPLCQTCPVAKLCPYPAKRMKA